MMEELRYETQQIVCVGLFLEKLKGEYPRFPYSGLQISWCWWRYLIKSDGSVVDIANRTWSEVPGCTGFYNLTLLPTDVNKKGSLIIYIHDSNFLGVPVVQRYTVINKNLYDSKYGSDLLIVKSFANKF